MVWINDHMSQPWRLLLLVGRDEGLRRSHSKFGLFECVRSSSSPGSPSRRADLWWHPYDRSLGKASASARLLYGRDSDKPAALRRGHLGPSFTSCGSLSKAFRR